MIGKLDLKAIIQDAHTMTSPLYSPNVVIYDGGPCLELVSDTRRVGGGLDIL